MERRRPASDLFELIASSLTRFGALPALWVVVATFVAVVSAAPLLPEGDTQEYVGIAVVVALTVHCFARPRGGWAVWSTCVVPAALGSLLHELAGAPPWIALLAIPLALHMAWDIDRADEVRATDLQSSPDRLPPLRP